MKICCFRSASNDWRWIVLCVIESLNYLLHPDSSEQKRFRQPLHFFSSLGQARVFAAIINSGHTPDHFTCEGSSRLINDFTLVAPPCRNTLTGKLISSAGFNYTRGIAAFSWPGWLLIGRKQLIVPFHCHCCSDSAEPPSAALTESLAAGQKAFRELRAE